MDTFRLARLASLAFLVGFLPVLPTSAGESSFDSSKASGETLSMQLQEALIAQGWMPVDAPDGSVSYLPPAPGAVAQAPEFASSERAFAASLREALEQQGWAAQMDGEGNRIYRKPAPAKAPVARASDLALAEQGTVTQQLRGELERQGWSAVRAAGGDLYYLPPKPVEASPPTIADRLSEDLERQGWARYTAKDGSVIYRAPESELTPPTAATTASSPTGPVASPTHVEQFKQQLQQSGWQVQPAGRDGTMLITPRPQGALPMARDSDVQGAVGQPGGELEAASLLGAEGFRHPQVSVVVPLQSEAVETSPQENGAPVSQLTDSVVAAYPAWARRPAHPCGRMAPPVPHGSPYWWPAPPVWRQPAWVWPQHGPYPYR